MRHIYDTIKYSKNNTTDYFFKSHNSQKVNEAYNGSLITRGVHDHGMNILFLLHTSGFDLLQENEKKEAEIAREEILCAILYLESLDKARFDELKKHVDDYFVLNKVEYTRTVTAVKSILLNYQPNYNSNEIINPKGSETSSCLHNTVKLGKTRATEK